MVPTRRLVRTVAALSAVVGVAHLLVPRHLLAAAQWGYDRVLAVDFRPREAAPRRVRLVGLGFVLTAALALRVRSGRSPAAGRGYHYDRP
jgi:hypothetical protein